MKHSILTLLCEGPAYGYQIRGEFEERTGGTWPLNIGQVYTTLERLERDGLVHDDGNDGEGHRVYSITQEGLNEVTSWFASPLEPTNPPRNELAIKIALAVASNSINITEVIQTQRSATLRLLQEYTRAKHASARRSDQPDSAHQELAGLLILESLIFTAEAEIRWLDHCEAHVKKLPFHPPVSKARATSTTHQNASIKP